MSSLVTVVRSMFDLPDASPAPRQEADVPAVVPGPGQIMLITGPSGSGKSQLLSAMKRYGRSGTKWVLPTDVRFSNASVIDSLCEVMDAECPQRAIESALSLLSRVGLAEAWTYLRPPGELSDGQRWRLTLAMMFAGASRSNDIAVIAMDEFAALLDRVTAMIVARALRTLISNQTRLSAIVVTSHDDLHDALRPDLHVDCDFGTYRVTVDGSNEAVR